MDFPTVAKNIHHNVVDDFVRKAEASIVFPGEDIWTFKSEKDDLLLEITRALATARESQLKLYMDQKKSDIIFSLQKSLAPVVEESKTDMWEEVREIFGSIKTENDREVEAILRDFGCEVDELKNQLAVLDEIEFTGLKSVLEERAKEISMIMTDTFKKVFELQGGVPRKWGKGDEEILTSTYKNALLLAESLVDRYSVIRINNDLPNHIFFQPGVDGVATITTVAINERDPEVAKLILIPSRDGKRILSQFREQTQSVYRSALQEVERAAATGAIPYYVIILGLILGANENWWVITTGLTNPLFLFLLIVYAGIAVAIWKLNLMPVILAMAAPIQSEVHNYLKFRLGFSPIPPPAVGSSSSTPKSEDHSRPATTTTSTSRPQTLSSTPTPKQDSDSGVSHPESKDRDDSL